MSSPAPNPPFTAAGLLMPVETAFLAASAASTQLLTGIGLIMSWSAANGSTTTSSRFRIYDGTDATGNMLVTCSMPAADSHSGSGGRFGILFQRGLWIDHLAGFYDLTLTYVPLLTQP